MMKCTRRSIVLLSAVVFLIVISFAVVLHRGTVYSMDESSSDKPEHLQELEKRNRTTKVGCHFPQLDPFDPSVMSKIKPIKLFTCKRVQPELFNLRNGTLRLNKTELGKNINISCYYRCVLYDDRYENIGYGASNVISLVDKPRMVLCETIYILCKKANGSSVYENRLSQVVPKITATGPELDVGAEAPNVVLLFIDSVSRSHFIRSLPKTRKFLLENLGFLEFTGLVTVGRNSFPNIIPALTGLPAPPINATPNATFDEWPFIWYNYSRKGYVTLEAEGMPHYGLYHAYGGLGFAKRPFNHYYRAHLRSLESFRHFVANDGTKCFGNRAKHEILLDYLMQLFEAYPSTPKFSHVLIGRLAHDTPNLLSGTDDTFLQFLSRFKGFLHNTFFFFLSDHGLRLGTVRETSAGEMESKLPFFMLRVPNWFSEQYPGLVTILESNAAGRLLSFYDIHETLEFILTQSWKRPLDERSNSNGPTHLFQPIPLSRTCPDAKIPMEQCVCYQGQGVNLSLNDSTVLAGSRFLIKYINRLLIPYKDRCHKLTLGKILSANVHELPINMIPLSAKDLGAESFATMVLAILVTVKPSNATLRAMMTYEENHAAFYVTNYPDRLDWYVKQSACLRQDQDIRPFCYCIKH